MTQRSECKTAAWSQDSVSQPELYVVVVPLAVWRDLFCLFVCLLVVCFVFLSKAIENETNREVWIVCCCCSTCCLRRQPGHTMCQVVPGDSRAHNTMLLMSWKAARGRGDRGRPGTHQESTQYLTHTHTNTIQCVTHTGARQRIQEGRKWVVGVTRWGLHRSSTLQT